MKTLLYTVLALLTYAIPRHSAGIYDERGRLIGKTTWKEC